MRKMMMAGNWKMNKTLPEAVALTQQLCNQYQRDWDKVDVVVCPPSVDLKAAWTVIDFDKTDIEVGCQNVFYKESGAYTGEISVDMIREVGCTYCIVGHSERREYFGETDQDVNLKTKALLAGGVSPIVCVGESLHVRDEGAYPAFITAQVEAALAGIDVAECAPVVFAYEPVWAIGTGRTATPEQAQEVCALIRGVFAAQFGEDKAQSLRVLYGGSMNPGNAEGLLAMPDIDGGLIGGAALQADTFRQLIAEAAKQQA